MRSLFFFVISILFAAHGALAQSRASDFGSTVDPRGEPELTICSQNLKNYGLYEDAKSRERGMDQDRYKEKEDRLAARFEKVNCDVIAVQELLGRNAEVAKEAIDGLAKAVRRHTNRFYDTRVGETNDGISRVGFLVAKDRAEIGNVITYKRVTLPKISEDQKPRLFSRAPLEVQLLVKPKGESLPKSVSLVTFHFKSKAGSTADSTGLEWETYRMEMAEGLRRILESRFVRAFSSGESPLVVLGDRNANFDIASAKILDGSLTLSNFQGQAPCRLSKRGVPLCQAGIERAQKLFSVLTGDPNTKRYPGTFVYEDVFSWLDDILLPAESLPLAWARYDESGDYDSGTVSDPKGASDHSMVWVRLNW